MSNMTEFEKNVLSLEEERVSLYRKEVEDLLRVRQKDLQLKEDSTARSIVPYNKMVYLVFIQTIVMVAQTLLFAGIYFKL